MLLRLRHSTAPWQLSRKQLLATATRIRLRQARALRLQELAVLLLLLLRTSLLTARSCWKQSAFHRPSALHQEMIGLPSRVACLGSAGRLMPPHQSLLHHCLRLQLRLSCPHLQAPALQLCRRVCTCTVLAPLSQAAMAPPLAQLVPLVLEVVVTSGLSWRQREWMMTHSMA